MNRARLLLMIGAGCLVVGVLLSVFATAPERTVPGEPAAAQIVISATAGVDVTPNPTIGTLSRATDTPVALVVAVPQPENVYWSDSFDRLDSGWEVRYDVPGPTSDPRMQNWNGYQAGGYVFALNGEPTVEGTKALSLWDFNPDISLPRYPYQVQANIAVQPAGNAMLLIDYVGAYSEIDSGDGLAVVWGGSDGETYKMVDAWPLQVYEFHNGHTWLLGCSAAETHQRAGTQSSMIVDVTSERVGVRLFSENRLTYSGQCERQYPGAQDSDRRLGIGAVYPRPAVPVKDFNQLSFEEVIVMTSETELQSMSVVPPIEEVMTGCDVVWLRQYSASQIGYPSIPITTVLGDRTLCHNPYSSYASDFPGYGPVRAEIREPGPPIGEWYCESDAPAARFRLDREHDYYRLEMDNESFYVFAATDIIPHTGRYVESEIVPYGYVVRRTPSGGNPTSFEPVRFVSFGDGIGVHDEMRYYFTYENGTISTNWNANVCRQR